MPLLLPLAATFADLPPATWGYLLLDLATLVLHVVFMGYVLAGSAYLAVVVTLRKPGERGPFEPLLREWLPFMLSLAITAGIGPLLFIQILYRPAYYTANLLLFHRWMAVLPVLIVGFYLLYLLKNYWADGRSRGLAIAISGVVSACFLFIAWSWTENHLLSLAGQEVWTQQHVSQSIVYHSKQLLPRLAMWFCGTFAVLAVWLSWQLSWTATPHRTIEIAGSRRAAALGIAGLIASALGGGLYGLVLSDAHRAALTDPSTVVPWSLVAFGYGAALVFFLAQFRDERLTPLRLSVLSGAMIVLLSGMAGLRESIRLASVDLGALVETTTSAATVGGRWAFAAFLVFNSLLIAWCLRSVLKSKTQQPRNI